MATQLVLLGTGTPNACPDASGPSAAVVVDGRPYLIDFGPGVVRQAAKAFRNGIDGLKVPLLSRAFLTHLHSDHTAGYADLIFTPWVLERGEPLQVFGPEGLKSMTEHLMAAYDADLQFRLSGPERANQVGCQVQAEEISPGIVYRDDRVEVEAFPVCHGTLVCYGYRFVTSDKVIVISGDTRPMELVAEKAKNCDILLHEVYYAGGLAQREEKWQNYHRTVHTGGDDLGKLAQRAQPKLLVTWHRIYHMDLQDNSPDIGRRVAQREEKILEEIRGHFQGNVINGHDLDVF